MSQLTKKEWVRFFTLMDKIVHSNELTYREIGDDIVASATEATNEINGEVEVWLETFANIFEGTTACKVGQKLDLEMADMKAEDLIAEDDDDEANQLTENDFSQ